MEFPFNHGHHYTQRYSADYSAPSPSPPPYHQADYSFSYGYPSAPSADPAYTLPGPNATVHHVAHETHHHYHIHFHVNVHLHHVSHQGGFALYPNKPTVRVFTKTAPNYSLTIRNGNVILAPSDPNDEYQHWYKDDKYSTWVKVEEGYPTFALVNKVTGEVIKHSISATHPVRLIRPHNPDFLDESILWSESRDLGDGYRAIRMVNNIHLNVDACQGDKKSGGVHDGTTIILWEWNEGDNQLWKILPYCKFLIHTQI